jgi:hypothetical protein
MAEEEKVKKIRDLENFSDPNPMTTGDHLIVSSSEGPPATNKATIKDIVSLYLTQSLEETAELEDTITLEDGTEIPNPLKGATTVQGVDTDGDGIPDKLIESVTTITSDNVDSLVQEGGGLEVVTICRDQDLKVVDCELPDGNVNTEVKYKTTKLQLATSAESKTITIDIDANEGVEYESGLAIIDGKINKKLKRLRDAFTYIRHDVSSSDTVININVLTDLDEGIVENTNATYLSDPHAETNKCTIHVHGAGFGVATNPKKIKIKTKRNGTNAYVPMWLNAITISFRFIHFVFDADDNLNLHTLIRSHLNCYLNLYTCKISARGGTFHVLECSRGGKIELHSLVDDLASLDYKNKGFWMPALELDFGPRKELNSKGEGEINGRFLADRFLGLNSGGSFRVNEYAPHIPWSSAFNTNFQSRIHFCSKEFRMPVFVNMEQNCMLDILDLFTISDGLGDLDDNEIDFFLRAESFNSVKANVGRHMAGNIVNGNAEETPRGLPGAALTSPNDTAGSDYQLKPDGLIASTSLLSTYKGRDGSGAATNGTLTNYWQNIDWNQDYDNL